MTSCDGKSSCGASLISCWVTPTFLTTSVAHLCPLDSLTTILPRRAEVLARPFHGRLSCAPTLASEYVVKTSSGPYIHVVSRHEHASTRGPIIAVVRTYGYASLGSRDNGHECRKSIGSVGLPNSTQRAWS